LFYEQVLGILPLLVLLALEEDKGYQLSPVAFLSKT